MPKKPSLLIVDDDEDMLETLSDVLQEKGYRTETAKTGKKAIEKARDHFFDVALVDIKLPDVTGIEVLRTFREIHPAMVNIVVTGYATLQNAMDALNVGANAYVLKPVDPERVDRMIREYVARAMKALAMSLEVPAFFLGKSISKHVLRRVVGLKDPMRKIFLALYGYGKPATAVEIAEPLGYTRTYVSKRLNQLELIGLVKRSKAGTKVLFEVVL